MDGLFGAEDEMLLPQKAHEAVVALAELYAMFDGAAGLLADETKPAPVHELKALLRNLQQMTIVADEQINKAMRSCKRARGQRLETMATVMSRKFAATGLDASGGQDATALDDDDEPDFIESPLSQSVTRNGVAVRIEIYGDSKAAGSSKSSTPRIRPMCGMIISRPISWLWPKRFARWTRSRWTSWAVPRIGP